MSSGNSTTQPIRTGDLADKSITLTLPSAAGAGVGSLGAGGLLVWWLLGGSPTMVKPTAPVDPICACQEEIQIVSTKHRDDLRSVRDNAEEMDSRLDDLELGLRWLNRMAEEEDTPPLKP